MTSRLRRTHAGRYDLPTATTATRNQYNNSNNLAKRNHETATTTTREEEQQRWVSSSAVGGSGGDPKNNSGSSSNYNSDHSGHNDNNAAQLTDRLQELLVFELHEDGGRQYLTKTVRGLYKYVLHAITATTAATAKPVLIVPVRSAVAPANVGGGGVDPTAQPSTVPEYDNGTKDGGNNNNNNSEPTQPIPSVPLPTLARRATVVIPPFQNTGSTTAKSAGAGANAANAITYRERLGGYLHPRDMRRLVTPFSTSNEPELIVRRHVMLLNFDPLRAIILRDRLLVLVPDGADSILVHLEQRVRGGSLELENSIFGEDCANSNTNNNNNASEHGGGGENVDSNSSKHKKHHPHPHINLSGLLRRANSKDPTRATSELTDDNDDGGGDEVSGQESTEHPQQEDTGDSDPRSPPDTTEWHEMEAQEWIKLPFELQCVDAVLHVVGQILEKDTVELQKASRGYIQRLLHDNSSLNDDPLTIIRIVKDAVQLMTNRVKGFAQSMNRLLDDDEDMALMNLSRLLTHPERFIQPVSPQVLEEESDEPELILESNLQIALTLMNYLDLIQGQINSAKELIDQKQDQTRNRLLLANMLFSVFSLCTTMASVVGSFMGMNVPIPNMHDEEAFRYIVGGSISGAIVLSVAIIALLYYTGTIPRTKVGKPELKL